MDPKMPHLEPIDAYEEDETLQSSFFMQTKSYIINQINETRNADDSGKKFFIIDTMFEESSEQLINKNMANSTLKQENRHVQQFYDFV